MVDTCSALGEEPLSMPVDATLWDGGIVLFEGRMPLAQLFKVIEGHVHGHAEQLSALGTTAG